jgi:drug/metabolite transporter (DMT)-like permease
MLVVLAAALVHATWNAIMHGIKDQFLAFGLLGAGGAIAAIPLVTLGAAPRPASWPYLAASIVIHLFYATLLMRSYRYGEFSQVYPLARGTSPLVVTALSAIFVHERPSAAELAGVVVVSAGLATLTFGGRSQPHSPNVLTFGRHSNSKSKLFTWWRSANRTAVIAAVGTGLTIAAYTVVDGVGIRVAHSPAGYTGWLMLLQSADMLVIALAVRRRTLFTQPRGVLARGTAAGALSVVAYGLVLWAQTRGALAPIAALRETSVIFGAIIGTAFFKEPFGRSRVIAAVVVAAGIVLLSS